MQKDRKSTRLNSSHQIISYAVFCPPHPPAPLFPYTTLFRSALPLVDTVSIFVHDRIGASGSIVLDPHGVTLRAQLEVAGCLGARHLGVERRPLGPDRAAAHAERSEEHTSELQSPDHLVCRLLPAPPPRSPLSLHDALPICAAAGRHC